MVKPNIQRGLGKIFASALGPAQLLAVRQHIDGGGTVCCGKIADWFLHPSGAKSIEAIVIPLENPLEYMRDGFAPPEWERLCMRLCAASEHIIPANAQLNKVMFALTDYTALLRSATQKDVGKAVSYAIAALGSADN